MAVLMGDFQGQGMRLRSVTESLRAPLAYRAECLCCAGVQMNTLAALQSVAERIGTPGEALLEAFRPRTYAERVNGRSLAAAGCEPILHMRAFQKEKRLPDALVADVLLRAQR